MSADGAWWDGESATGAAGADGLSALARYRLALQGAPAPGNAGLGGLPSAPPAPAAAAVPAPPDLASAAAPTPVPTPDPDPNDDDGGTGLGAETFRALFPAADPARVRALAAGTPETAGAPGADLDLNTRVGASGFGGGLADFARGAAGGVRELPGLVADAGRFVGRLTGLVEPSTGAEIAGLEAERQADARAAPAWTKESQIGALRTDPLSLRGGAYEAGESTAQSLGPMATGAAIGAGIGSLVGGVGALPGAGIGALVGTVASVLGFAGQQAEASYEHVKAATGDEDAALKAGVLNGLIEGGGEALGDMLFLRAGRLVPPGVRKEAGSAIARALGLKSAAAGGGDVVQSIASNQGALWRAAKDIAFKVAPAEVATEIGQGVGQAEVEQYYGAGAGATWDDALRVVVPTLIMTGLGAGGAHAFGAYRRAQVNQLLTTPDDGSTDGMAARAGAAFAVERELRRQDRTLADLWHRYAVAAIGDGVPLTIDEDQFYRDLSEQGAAGQRLAPGAGSVPGAQPGAEPAPDARLAGMLQQIQTWRAAEAANTGAGRRAPPSWETDPNAKNVDGIAPGAGTAPGTAAQVPGMAPVGGGAGTAPTGLGDRGATGATAPGAAGVPGAGSGAGGVGLRPGAAADAGRADIAAGADAAGAGGVTPSTAPAAGPLGRVPGAVPGGPPAASLTPAAPAGLTWGAEPLEQRDRPVNDAPGREIIHRSDDGAWARVQRVGADGAVVQETVLPFSQVAAARAREEAARYQGFADDAMRWQAAHPSQPFSRELQERLSAVADQRDRWRALSETATPRAEPRAVETLSAAPAPAVAEVGAQFERTGPDGRVERVAVVGASPEGVSVRALGVRAADGSWGAPTLTGVRHLQAGEFRRNYQPAAVAEEIGNATTDGAPVANLAARAGGAPTAAAAPVGGGAAPASLVPGVEPGPVSPPVRGAVPVAPVAAGVGVDSAGPPAAPSGAGVPAGGGVPDQVAGTGAGGARRAPGAARTIDPERDDLLAAVAKAGGLSRAEAESNGIDPAAFRTRGSGIHFVFTRGGDSLDGMAERLAQHGYPVRDEAGNHSPNALLDRLDEALRGQRVVSVRAAEREGERALEDLAARHEADWEMDGLPSAVDAAAVDRDARPEGARNAALWARGVGLLGEEGFSDLLERANERAAISGADLDGDAWDAHFNDTLQAELEHAERRINQDAGADRGAAPGGAGLARESAPKPVRGPGAAAGAGAGPADRAGGAGDLPGGAGPVAGAAGAARSAAEDAGKKPSEQQPKFDWRAAKDYAQQVSVGGPEASDTERRRLNGEIAARTDPRILQQFGPQRKAWLAQFSGQERRAEERFIAAAIETFGAGRIRGFMGGWTVEVDNGNGTVSRYLMGPSNYFSGPVEAYPVAESVHGRMAAGAPAASQGAVDAETEPAAPAPNFDDDVPFRRDPQFGPQSLLGDNAAPRGLTVGEVQGVVADFGRRLLGASGQRVAVQVFATQDDAFGPGSIARFGRIKGAYYPVTGKIVLIGAHLGDLRDARETLRHEVVGHLGLNLLAPADKRAFLELVLQAAETSRHLRRIKAEETRNNPTDPLKVAEEVFARVVESGRSNLGLAWDRLLIWLRTRLRALGVIEGRPGLAEMRVFAADLARAIRAGQAPRSRPGSDQARFSRTRAPESAPELETDPRLKALLATYVGVKGAPSAAELAEAVRQYRAVEARYADVLRAHDQDGAPLPAPNGQPSKLNREQWVLVRTENFKRWFGEWEGAARQEHRRGLITRALTDTAWQARAQIAAGYDADPSGKLSDAFGFPVVKTYLTPDDLRKTNKRHGAGNERRNDQEGLALDDYLKALEVLRDPETFKNTVPNNGKPSAEFGRRFSDGTYVIAEVEIAEPGAVAIKSAWKKKPGRNHEGAAPFPIRTSATTAGVPLSISSDTLLVNPDAVSKVADANGEPLVMYHGTSADFDRFAARSTGQTTLARDAQGAFFFTTSREVAEDFAGYLYTTPDGVLVERTYTEGAHLMPVFLRATDLDVWDMGGGAYAEGFQREAIRDARRARRDAILFQRVRDGSVSTVGPWKPSNVVAVFKPEQIKSAIGNAGTYGPKRADIRFHLGGVERTAAAATDADYLAAVARGDLETAQRMVAAAAQARGYGATTYRMDHEAPDRQNQSLVTLKESGMVPDDYWEHPDWYQTTPHEHAAFAVVRNALQRLERGRSAPGLTLYRAVPKAVKDATVRNGDWVTPVRAYAEEEGANIPGGYRIIEQWAPLRHLWWDGNSIAELGYDDGQEYGYRNTKNNRKSLDAVTYDDEGNVIPLSKRFNFRADDPRFAVGRHAITRRPGPAGGAGVSAAFMQAKVDADPLARALRAQHGLPVRVVQSERELPAAARAELARVREKNPQAFPKALWVPATDGGRGEVLLVADNLFDAREGLHLVWEEGVGHFGLTAMLGPEFGGFLDTVIAERNADVDAWARAYGLDMQDPGQRRKAAEEFLAHTARLGREADRGLLERVYQAIRRALRALGVTLRLSDGDLREVLAAAHRYALGDRAGAVRTRARVAGLRGKPDGGGRASAGARAMFAGQGAKTADPMALASAEERLAQGEDPEAVRQATGWHRGADGKWRFEIDDAQARLTDAGWRQMIGEGETNLARLGEALEHPALFAAYPELRDYGVLFTDGGLGGANGSIDASQRLITIDRGASRPLSTLLHEIQHGVQNVEGFARGGNISEQVPKGYTHAVLADAVKMDELLRSSFVNNDTDKAKTLFLNQKGYRPSGLAMRALEEIGRGETLKQAMERSKRGGFEGYRRLAGEVEARNTQARQGLTAAERRATAPQATQDVPDSDVIVVWNGREMASAPRPENAGELPSDPRELPETIDVDGVQRPTTNSEGRPIHPTEEGIRNFYRWFGDSKVVDDQGRPWMAYHGAGSAFTVFDPSYAGLNTGHPGARLGFYFAPRRSGAIGYAGRGGSEKPIVGAYLAMSNPAFLTWRDTPGSEQEADALRARLEDQGFDGAIFDAETPAEATELVVFGANQIKSATDNTGAFSPANPDIRFALAAHPDPGGSPLGGGRRLLASIRQVLEHTGEWAGDRWRQALPVTLGALTLRQLTEWGKTHVPALAGYQAGVGRMEVRRNALIEESGVFASDVWQAWSRKAAHRAEAEDLARLMHDATLAQVDPADYEVLKIAVKLGPDALDWRTREATEENVKKLLADSRRFSNSKAQADRGKAGFYALAAKQLARAVRAEQRRRAALPALEARWNKLSSGRTFDDQGQPYASEAAAEAALQARAKEFQGLVVYVDERAKGEWVIQEAGAQQIYRKARDLYKTRSEQMRDARIQEIENSKVLDDAGKRKLIAQIRRAYEDPLDEKGNPKLGPYFPLWRAGRYYVVARRFPTGERRLSLDTSTDPDGMAFATKADAAKAAKSRADLKQLDVQPVWLGPPVAPEIEGVTREDAERTFEVLAGGSTGAIKAWERQMDQRYQRDKYRALRAEFNAQTQQRARSPGAAGQGPGWALEEVGEPGFWKVETVREQRALRAQLQAAGWQISSIGITDETHKAVEGVTEGFIAEAVEKLRAKGAMDEADQLYQLYLNTLGEMSMRKHFIHRKGITGYSQDALRAFAWNMGRMGYQIARAEHMPDLTRILMGIKDGLDERRREGGDVDIKVPQEIFLELNKRHGWIMSPTNASWVNKANAFGFTWLLGLTPGAALVNLSQVPIMALPILAGRFRTGGWGAATRELGRAYVDVARGFNPEVILSYVQGRPHPNEAAGLSAEERAAFADWTLSGVRDNTRIHNLAGIGEGGDRFTNSPEFNRTMAVVSSGFHAAEVLNRDVTLLAAYRLARAEGLSHAEAVHQAEEATWEAHFDLSNLNRARWMQGDIAKALLMFKSYAQHVTWFMWRNAYLATRGESAAVKAEARTKLLGSLGMTGVFSGLLGLPLIGTVFAIANLAAAAFGDDDEPWDAETEFRNLLARIFPRDMADILDRGVANKVTGLDWANRVGMDGLWWRDPASDLDGKGAFRAIEEQLLGPVVSIASSPFTAYDYLNRGDWARAAETLSPKALRDLLQAGRYAREGVLSTRGAPIIEEGGLNAYQLVWKALGMNPDELAVRREANSAVKNYERRILDRRTLLMTAYGMATIHQDAEAQARVLGKIRAFNLAQPLIPITPRTLRQSVRNRQKAIAEAEHGMAINKRLRGQLEAVGAFGG